MFSACFLLASAVPSFTSGVWGTTVDPELGLMSGWDGSRGMALILLAQRFWCFGVVQRPCLELWHGHARPSRVLPPKQQCQCPGLVQTILCLWCFQPLVGAGTPHPSQGWETLIPLTLPRWWWEKRLFSQAGP